MPGELAIAFVCSQESTDLVDVTRPRGLMRKDEMILALERLARAIPDARFVRGDYRRG